METNNAIPGQYSKDSTYINTASMLPNFKSHSQKLLGQFFAPQDPLYFYHLHDHLHSVPIGLSEALSKDGSHLIAVASWAEWAT